MKTIAIGTHRLPLHEALWRTSLERVEAVAFVLSISAALLAAGVRVVARVIANVLKILLFAA